MCAVWHHRIDVAVSVLQQVARFGAHVYSCKSLALPATYVCYAEDALLFRVPLARSGVL
jgi:hypothetical protein